MTSSVLLVVEDQPDIRLLVQLHFERQPGFTVMGEAADAASALAQARLAAPDLVVLDHRLEGEVTGMAIAPQLKAVAPGCKIILFTASEELREAAHDSPAIDAFLLKTQLHKLVELAQQLLGQTDRT